MKHLLIILSILLLSSPVIGQETGVLYQYETSTGIKWKTFGDGKVQPKYKGEIKNGKMDGLGVLIYPYGGKSVVGEWKNGEEWNTKHRNKDGKLIGKFENGKWNEWVLLYSGMRNGEMGYFKWEWKGKETEGNWDWGKYEGGLKDGKPNGQGTETLSLGIKYVGKWKNGVLWNGTKYDWKGKIEIKYVNGIKYKQYPPLKQIPPKKHLKVKYSPQYRKYPPHIVNQTD